MYKIYLLIIFITFSINIKCQEMNKKIVKHKKYQEFQNKYGYIPASDKNDIHIIKSRMLQGIYRNNKIENVYCNYIPLNNAILNFMNNERIYNEALIILKEIKSRKRITDENRLLTNLLSSQPLAFNLFIPLSWNDYNLATTTFQNIFPELNIEKITNIKLEFVPGDTNSRKQRVIKIDNSCFDIFIEYKQYNSTKLSCFGVEAKYTESFSKTDFNNAKGIKKDRYIEAIKKYNNIFYLKYQTDYLGSEINQLFRNQLITEEVKDKFDKYDDCKQIVLYSKEDTKCIKAINDFNDRIKIKGSFLKLTIEDLINEILEHTNDNETKIYKAIYNRYCNYNLVNQFFN